MIGKQYTTLFIIKIYILMNLLTVLLLFMKNLNFIFLGIEFITIYLACTSIYCFLEGNCLLKVISIFFFYFFAHLFSFLILKGYFPKQVKYLMKYKDKLEKLI